MQRNLPVLPLIAVVFSFFNWNCTKIDTTTLGSDLIPAVDNVHTFENIFSIQTNQVSFNEDDSIKVKISDLHVLGNISNDPVFGTTNAKLYFELKPSFYPYYFGIAGDTINPSLIPGTQFDSAVLCLSFKSYYGDTTIPQRLRVYVLDEHNENFIKDSAYHLNYVPDGGANNGLGFPASDVKTILPTSVRGYTYFYPTGNIYDSVNNQIRISLNDAFLQNYIANWDTTPGSGKPYLSDSLFRSKIKGFAVVAEQGQGNGLFYVNLQDAATRLEVHYKKRNKNIVDTAYSSFSFINTTGVSINASAQATNLTRDRSGAEYNPPQTTTDALYIQTAPGGSYINLKIPSLDTLPNCIVHRAEIIIEQIPSALDNVLAPPLNLYLDLVDSSGNNKFKPIYKDLNPSSIYYPDQTSSSLFFPGGGINYNYYGGYVRQHYDGAASPRYYYNFNVSRYVQQMVTSGGYNYNLRLYAPLNLYYYGYTIPFVNNIANGRIKVGSGSNPNDSYRMKMRIVYSKI